MMHRRDKHSSGPILVHALQGYQSLKSDSRDLHCHGDSQHLLSPSHQQTRRLCGLSAANPSATSSRRIKKLPDFFFFFHLDQC